jgi:hypothetical protein
VRRAKVVLGSEVGLGREIFVEGLVLRMWTKHVNFVAVLASCYRMNALAYAVEPCRARVSGYRCVLLREIEAVIATC